MPNAKTGKSKTQQQESQTQAVDEGVGSLSDRDYLRSWILDCHKEAEEATTDLRDKWKTLWQTYQNKQDYSKKEDWQSKTCIPKLFMAVERASLLIERALLQTSKLFHIELDDEFVLPFKDRIRQARKQVVSAEKQAAGVTKQAQEVLFQAQQAPQPLDPRLLGMLDFHQKAMAQAEQVVTAAKEALDAAQDELHDYEDDAKHDDARFKANLKKTNFLTAYAEMLKAACLLGFGVLKRVWKQARLCYEAKDILRVKIAPDYKPFQDEAPRYVIEERDIDLATLLEMAQKTNAKHKEAEPESPGPFDLDEIEKIDQDYGTTDDKEKDRLDRLGLSEHKHLGKKVLLLEFWGQVVSRDGKHIIRDRMMLLANEKYLIRNQDNPFEPKKSPYEFCVPMVYPHRGVAGISMVEAEVKLQWTLNNILNLFVDSMTFTVSPMFEYDPQKLQEAEKMTRIFPGKRILLKPGTQGPVINQVKTQGIEADAFRVFEIVKSELQEGTTVTEFLTSMPGKQAKTLGEVEIKTAESHGYFDVIGRKLEVNSIAKLLHNSYEMLQQFRDDFKNLERYQFNVGGVSLLLLQKQQMEYLVQALSIAMKNPQIAAWTNLKDLWERLLSVWNLDEAHREDEPEAEAMPTRPQLMAPGQMAGGTREPSPATGIAAPTVSAVA